MTYGVIDSDAHLVETERTWEYMDPADERFKPVLAAHPTDPQTQWWMVNGKACGFRFATLNEQEVAARSQLQGRELATPPGTRDGANVDLRIAYMDQLEVDVQVLLHTIFTEQVTDAPEVEVAICKSWNRWAADIWRQGAGRLRWCCVPPLTNIDAAIEQIRWSSQHGAVGVSMRAIEGRRMITDPYFYPVYDEASRLDLTIAVHIGTANPEWVEVTRPVYDTAIGLFNRFKLPTIGACQVLVMSEVPKRFPRLRWGFIEASSAWAPLIVQDARRRKQSRGESVPDDILREYNIWITCQNDDDLPYVLKSAPNSLVYGTDFGHYDHSTEVHGIQVFRGRTDIDEATKRKILWDNARELWAL